MKTFFQNCRVAACAITLLSTSSLHAAGQPLTPQEQGAAQASFKEWAEVLAIPNDSVVAADIQRNAAWFEQAFQRRGFHTRQLENNGKPLLFAEFPQSDPALPTVLFYGHMDGQPVTPSEWQQESPWTPTLKQRNAAGQWETMPLDKLFAKEVDPEWRLFGRASADDKAPIMMLLAAMDALKAGGKTPAINIKVILDAEEEKGSPSLGEVVDRNRGLLKSDMLLVLDGPMHPSNQPTLVFGNRGIVIGTLKVFGPKQDSHSGHYGNYAANPAQLLARLLASMKDDQGRVTVPGYYDGVKLDPDSLRVMRAVPDDETALRKRLGIATADKVGQNYQEAMQYPSLNVRGMKAGDVGDKARTIVPALAIAELDLRTVPETDPAALEALLKGFIERQGYHLVNGEPSDADRARYPKLASLAFESASASSSAVRTDLNAPIGKWLRRAMTKTYGKEPVQIRMMGGTVPTGALVAALKVPFVIVPLVNADNNQHSANENMRLGNYINGVHGLVGILSEPFNATP
ncbi:MAG: M20/M25/M40 family metallo-hydrolase [Collimonas sp.]|uniref:M20/M25/M40 family metallo-hydrolase n=1 Tax=Collimonas sp. TaxID=1963772 RepID=UPI0032663EBA